MVSVTLAEAEDAAALINLNEPKATAKSAATLVISTESELELM